MNLPQAGIVRFVITDKINGRGAWRFQWSKDRHPAAVELYRRIFCDLDMPVLPGYAEVRCKRAEFEAGYDYALGIDVVLQFESGMTGTLQEKFLQGDFKDVTVEYMQNPLSGERGDWFNMKAQYYFVGYDRENARSFQDWILLNWPALQQATAQGWVKWRDCQNKHDGAQASFRATSFLGLPTSCVVASSARKPALKPIAPSKPTVVSPKPTVRQLAFDGLLGLAMIAAHWHEIREPVLRWLGIG